MILRKKIDQDDTYRESRNQIMWIEILRGPEACRGMLVEGKIMLSVGNEPGYFESYQIEFSFHPLFPNRSSNLILPTLTLFA